MNKGVSRFFVVEYREEYKNTSPLNLFFQELNCTAYQTSHESNSSAKRLSEIIFFCIIGVFQFLRQTSEITFTIRQPGSNYSSRRTHSNYSSSRTRNISTATYYVQQHTVIFLLLQPTTYNKKYNSERKKLLQVQIKIIYIKGGSF